MLARNGGEPQAAAVEHSWLCMYAIPKIC
jgi:hypothetical protein